MSGLEAIGVAASIIQVADLGTKLSVRLFSLYRRFKDADQALRDLSSDVALTCAILRELGESIEKDEQSKLCSEEAFRTLKSILSQCREVLEQIQNMIDYRNNSRKTPLQRMTEKIRNVLLEPSLDPLKSNLERLKSTMLLLLNVIMYAGQIRSKHVPTLLQEQRGLLESLLEEKRSDERGPDQFAFVGLSQVTGPESSSSKIHAQNDGDPNSIDGPDELKQYNFLIQRMLQEIDLCKSKLESSRHTRIKDGVLNIHSGEIVRFQLEYGHTILQNFDHSLFADRSTNRPDLKPSAKNSPASEMPYPPGVGPQRRPPSGRSFTHTNPLEEDEPLLFAPSDFKSSRNLENIENSAPISTASSPEKPISPHTPDNVATPSRLTSDDIDSKPQSPREENIIPEPTASSPGEPISPHTLHTPAIPTRLTSNDIVEYGDGDVDRRPTLPRAGHSSDETIEYEDRERLPRANSGIESDTPHGATMIDHGTTDDERKHHLQKKPSDEEAIRVSPSGVCAIDIPTEPRPRPYQHEFSPGSSDSRSRERLPRANSDVKILTPAGVDKIEIYTRSPTVSHGSSPMNHNFIPSRQRSNYIAHSDDDEPLLFCMSDRQAAKDLVDGEQGGRKMKLKIRQRPRKCRRPDDIWLPNLPVDEPNEANVDYLPPPKSTSLNDDSLPENLVDLMLRWTNIQRDELELERRPEVSV
ncbi:hypothetical protein DTO195F2_5287 [Paecilomyces variotii]|nr:hypothetical protein DTO195F2_5287 [Paecilomyces variotii]